MEAHILTPSRPVVVFVGPPPGFHARLGECAVDSLDGDEMKTFSGSDHCNQYEGF